MKVLHIIESLRGGGKERQLVELLKGFDDSTEVNNEVILLKDINQYPETELLKTKFHTLKRKIKKDPTVFFKIDKIIKEFKPDIIQSWGTMPSIYCVPLVLKNKLKFVNCSIRDSFCPVFSQNWFRSKLTFGFSDVIVGNSYSGIDAYSADLKKSFVIYNGVHLNRFENKYSKEATREKFNVKPKYVVGMVGAFHSRKDWYTFFSAAKLILSQRKDICFISIGDGKNINDFKKMMASYPEENVKFLGRQNDVESLVDIMDICVLSTNTDVHREGIANVIIEYMAMAKPVIATFGGGTPEIIDNNYNGILIRPHDEIELKNKIIFLLNNPDLIKIYGQRAKDKVINEFTIERMLDSFTQLYKRTLQ